MPHPLTDLLLAHRASGTPIESLPSELAPVDAAAAYLVQNEVASALGPVGAWKVQPMPETGEPFASPILRNVVFEDGADLKAADFHGLAIEVEVAVTIARDLPQPTQPYAASDLHSAIASVHAALEIVASRFRDRKAVPPLAGIADFQSNGAVVVGPAISAENLPEFARQSTTLQLDGAASLSSTAGASTANMLSSLAWLANHAAARGLPLKQGDVVITGARIGPVAFSGHGAFADAEGLGTVSCTFS
jgi:2-keto-4-pentenoate hydratase